MKKEYTTKQWLETEKVRVLGYGEYLANGNMKYGDCGCSVYFAGEEEDCAPVTQWHCDKHDGITVDIIPSNIY